MLRTLCTLVAALALVTAPVAAAAQDDARNEIPAPALYSAIGAMGLGGAALVTGGVWHALAEDDGDAQVAYILYAGGGFLVLVGVYILGTAAGGHPGGDAAQATVGPWVAPQSGGLIYTGRF